MIVTVLTDIIINIIGGGDGAWARALAQLLAAAFICDLIGLLNRRVEISWILGVQDLGGGDGGGREGGRGDGAGGEGRLEDGGVDGGGEEDGGGDDVTLHPGGVARPVLPLFSRTVSCRSIVRS